MHNDQQFFEILYEFLLLTTWICYGYENWATIQSELGKFFRTSAFNRDDIARSDDARVELDGLGSVAKESSEYTAYRVHYDRPPPGSLKRLLSPALTSIFPSSKEKSSSSPKHDAPPWSGATSTAEDQLGIIGNKRSGYNPYNLRLLEIRQNTDDADIENEAEDDAELT